MKDLRTHHLRLLQEELSQIARDVTRIRLRATSAQPPWQPRINVSRS